MITSLARTAAYGLTAFGAAAAVVAAAGSASAAIDPSAYGIAAVGPRPLAAQPAVDWTSGAALSAQSGPVTLGPVHLATVSVDAGDGFATSRLTGLDIAGHFIGTVTANCRDGATSLTSDGARLEPGEQIPLPGLGTLTIGATTTNTDTSRSITALTITLPAPSGTEVITLGQARCGQG